MTNFLNIALIITSVGLILSIILQSKGAGLGGLTGADTGGVFTARTQAFLDAVPNARVEKPFDRLQLKSLVAERLV